MTACAAVILSTLAACSSDATNTAPASGTPVTANGNPSAQTPCGVATQAPTYEHVVWLVMENRDANQVIGSSDAPYFNELANKCGLATNSHARTHPSLPNYIAMTSGSTQGITDDGVPGKHPLDVPSIFSQLGAGKWRSLSQSMPNNCYAEETSLYVPRHNPPTYYINIAAQCDQQAVPLGDTPDLSAPFTFIAPNQENNTHDTDIRHGDDWLSTFIPAVLDSAQYRSGKTLLVITYDEDENKGSKENQIPTLVVSPSTRSSTKDDTYYSHYSLLRTTEELLGLELLGNAKDAASMRSGFNI